MKHLLISTAAALALASQLSADEIGDLKAQLKALTERLETIEAGSRKQTEQTQSLADELINVQNAASFTTVDITKAESGLGAAASKVYYSKNPLSIGGYGELFYASDRHVSAAEGGARSEAYRFVPYIGYKFSDSIILNSEIEFEHGGEEISIEQLYVDFLLDTAFNIRVGNQIVPMGLVNLNHEPVLFNTVMRPDVERYLIPSTWHENGLTAYGKGGGFQYAAGMIAALDMGKATHDGAVSERGKNWIRDARRGGNETNGEISNIGGVARIDYTGTNGLLLGASVYVGKAGPANASGMKEGSAFMYDLHGQYQYEGFKIKGLYTETTLKHPESYVGGSYTEAMPKNGRGGYLNFEYNILPHFVQTGQRLPVFFQYENYNLATRLSDGRSYGNTESFTYGINYFPHEQVVVKAEYLSRSNKNSVGGSVNEEICSVGLGFIF